MSYPYDLSQEERIGVGKGGCPPGLGTGQMHTNTFGAHMRVVSLTAAWGLSVFLSHVCMGDLQAASAGLAFILPLAQLYSQDQQEEIKP